jgi:F420H(2)-dependent quinone reductase
MAQPPDRDLLIAVRHFHDHHPDGSDTMSKPPNPLMRAIFRLILREEAWRFRRSGGTATHHGHSPLLLTTTGRRTGKRRTVPLLFYRDGDRLIVIAAFAGSDRHPGWWLNLRDAGIGQVEVGGASFPIVPDVLEGAERERNWRAMAAFWPDYDGYVLKTERRIPVIALSRVDAIEGRIPKEVHND